MEKRSLLFFIIACLALLFASPLYGVSATSGGCIQGTSTSLLEGKPEQEILRIRNLHAKGAGTSEVAFLWYPRYPDGSPNYTHAKLMVDGVVYGTMGSYLPMREYRHHVRLGFNSLQNSFLKFDLKVNPDEIARLRAIFARGTYKAEIHGCVQGACAALKEARILTVPFPFNQLPSLAALYLGTVRYLPNSKVGSVQFIGRSKLKSALSPDIAYDAVNAVAAGSIGVSLGWLSGYVAAHCYVSIHNGVLRIVYDDDDPRLGMGLLPEHRKP